MHYNSTFGACCYPYCRSCRNSGELGDILLYIMMGWFVEHNTHAKDNIETLHAIDTKRRARDRNKIQRENREIKRKKVK